VPLEGKGIQNLPCDLKLGNKSKTERTSGTRTTKHNCNQMYIAEDNLTLQKLYSRQLNKKSVPHTIFDNGQFLYDSMLELQCDSCEIIFIFTDLKMPQMDGDELATRLRLLKDKRF